MLQERQRCVDWAVQKINDLLALTNDFKAGGKYYGHKVTSKHLGLSGDEHVIPQIRLSAKLGEVLASSLQLSRGHVDYLHYQHSGVYHKDAFEKRLDRVLAKNNAKLHLTGVPGASAPIHHSRYGNLYPTDKLYRAGELVFIIRRPSVSLNIEVGQEWTYWVLPYQQI